MLLLGNKMGMTTKFNKNGFAEAITIIKSGPCFVTQIFNINKNGYNAIQIGYNERATNNQNFTKPQLGHFKAQNLPAFKYLKEFRSLNNLSYKLGEKLSINGLKIGQTLNISSLTIGKGNSGNLKRHHFSRGPMSHGSKHKRMQGSLGAGTFPGRVFPGKKMPGRLGTHYRTIQNLKILDLDIPKNLITIKGSLPGKTGNLLTIVANLNNS